MSSCIKTSCLKTFTSVSFLYFKLILLPVFFKLRFKNNPVFRYWMLGAGALGRPRGMEWGRRREEGSGWGTHVYLWRIHFDIWQN